MNGILMIFFQSRDKMFWTITILWKIIKVLEYLRDHSDIGVTMNTYTHLGMDDTKDEMIRLQELEAAKKELEKATGKAKPATVAAFKVV